MSTVAERFSEKNNKRSSLFLYIPEVKDGASRPFLYDNLTNNYLLIKELENDLCIILTVLKI